MSVVKETKGVLSEDGLEFTNGVVCSTNQRESINIFVAYFTFFACAVAVCRMVSEQGLTLSITLTLSAGVQCLGFLLLLLKVRDQKTVAGISSRSLEMYALVFLFRLSSTLVKNGYIPMDSTGNWVYQCADMASLMIVLQLLYATHVTHSSTYQGQHDALEMFRAIPVCLVLAFVLHGNLDRSPFFDMMWTTSMHLDTIAMVPQLYMFSRKGGEIEGLTAHFVVCIVLSRCLSFAFWFYGFPELSPADGGFNFAGWNIVLMHAVQLLLCGDFVCHYVDATVKGRRVVMPALDV